MCQMTYEVETQGKIIGGQHPLEFYMNSFSPVFVTYGLNDRDIFATYNCKQGNMVMADYKFKWARLWQVLPGGQPPGS